MYCGFHLGIAHLLPILGLLSFCLDGAKPIQPILSFRFSCGKIARRSGKGLGM
jgi:hypothetical protein